MVVPYDMQIIMTSLHVTDMQSESWSNGRRPLGQLQADPWGDCRLTLGVIAG